MPIPSRRPQVFIPGPLSAAASSRLGGVSQPVPLKSCLRAPGSRSTSKSVSFPDNYLTEAEIRFYELDGPVLPAAVWILATPVVNLVGFSSRWQGLLCSLRWQLPGTQDDWQIWIRRAIPEALLPVLPIPQEPRRLDSYSGDFTGPIRIRLSRRALAPLSADPM
jgi:hypothetical protein